MLSKHVEQKGQKVVAHTGSFLVHANFVKSFNLMVIGLHCHTTSKRKMLVISKTVRDMAKRTEIWTPLGILHVHI